MKLWPVEYFWFTFFSRSALNQHWSGKKSGSKVFNLSEFHFSEVTSYKIHTLDLPMKIWLIYLGQGGGGIGIDIHKCQPNTRNGNLYTKISSKTLLYSEKIMIFTRRINTWPTYVVFMPNSYNKSWVVSKSCAPVKTWLSC